MGGRVASYIAGDTPGVNGLVFLGYPLHPPGKKDQLRDQHLYALKIPMLFISGTKDTFAEGDLLDSVVAKIGTNATLEWIQGGDHSLKRGRKDTESLPMAADHDAAGNVYVAGFVAARSTVSVSRFDDHGRLAWSVDALTDLGFSSDAHVDVVAGQDGANVIWRGLQNKKRARITFV